MSINEIIDLTGREEITTGISTDASLEVLIEDLKLTLPRHSKNAIKISYLFDYWRGKQPILDRIKEVREDIDNKLVINLAQSSTRQITGYTFGKPIEFIHKLEDDVDEMRTLNNCFTVENKSLIDNEIFTDMSVCGLGYRAVIPLKGYDKGDYELGVSPFSLTRLDPSTTFVVYSTGIPKRVVYGVAYHYEEGIDERGQVVNFTIYNVYLGNRQFKFKVEGINAHSDLNNENLIDQTQVLIKDCPIIEYRNNMSMMGDWEPAISIIDALNVVGSDGVNDIVQFVQSLLVFINAELDDAQIELLKKNKMFSLISSKELNADVKYIAQQVDAASVQFLTEWLEGMFDTVVGIPDRKSRGGGGGDTGEAVKLRDGWGDLEIVARNKEPYVSKGERETLKFAISTLMTYNLINDLKIYDVEIKYSRNKSDNLLVKTQSYSNLVSTKTMTPEDSMNVCDFTNDSKETAGKGKAYWDEEADKVMEQENTKLGLQAELTRAASETTGDENNENNGNQKD